MFRARAKQAATAAAGVKSGPHKFAAAVLWLAAVYTTWLFLDALRPGTSVWVAVLVQFVLTVIESDFFRGERNLVTVAFTAIDTLINAGGLWPLMLRLDETQTWSAAAAVTGAQGGVSPVNAAILALVFGLVLAAAPERIWK